MLGLAIYRDALWGKALLAPLDCGPALMPKFRYADPENKGVPSNHYLIDLFTYNLPMQHTLYQAYREGKVPWWDPYTYAGRPLLADTPINGTDPVRLGCYAVLPFEMAYNWVEILYSVLTGLGMLLLLRRWQVRAGIAVLLALGYQFSAYFALALHMPTLQPPLAWLPFLWLAWDSWWRKPNHWSLPAGSVVVALIFYTGNLQTHAYLVLFALAFLLGYGGLAIKEWRKLLQWLRCQGFWGPCWRRRFYRRNWSSSRAMFGRWARGLKGQGC